MGEPATKRFNDTTNVPHRRREGILGTARIAYTNALRHRFFRTSPARLSAAPECDHQL
jgi:hypothetical protein